MESLESNSNLEGKEKLTIKSIPKIVAYLESLGLTSAASHLPEDQRESYFTFETGACPLVKDGGHGIRASYDKYDDKFTVWFTNSFERLDNPTRLQVEEWLKSNFNN